MPKLLVNWDPKNLEIKSRSVEDQLAPLIIEITTLVNPEKKGLKKGRGRSKKPGVLVAAVQRATQNFIKKGEEIAEENPPIKDEMLEVVTEIKKAGEAMSAASSEFALDPCNSTKRAFMVNSARSLLISVTRLLILADMLDIQLFLDAVNAVEASLEKLKNSQPQQLIDELKNFTKAFSNLLTQASRRQQELLDPQRRDDLAAARAMLKRSTTMLMSASKAYVQHPDNAAIIQSKERVLKQMCEAVNTIKEVTQGRTPLNSGIPEGPGKIARHLDALENYKEVHDKRQLELQVEELVNGIKLMSESTSINDERKKKITDSCDAVKAALQNLLAQSMAGKQDFADVNRKAKDLKRHLRKAVADQVSENFDITSPLNQLVMAAEAGNLQQVEICAEHFTQHNENLLKMAEQVCDLSNKEEGVKMVRFASSQLFFLYPEVENAAKFLAQYPQSLVAKENMDTFRKEYERQVEILLAAVDDITTIDDILSVLDNNMYEDMDAYIVALQEHNPEKLKSILENIKGRVRRVCDVATTEMDNYEPCIYTGNVMEAVRVLREDIITEFEEKTETVVTVFEENPDADIDDHEFLDASRLVYEGVREVRRAVLMNRTDEELDPEEVELEGISYYTDTLTRTVTSEITSNVVTDFEDDVSGITVARKAMDKLPEKEKQRIQEHVENFESEKLTFDREVAKWDDASNDVIVLAKHMCIIMLYMTDFIRQKGPLKSTADVINAAKKISEAGTKLDKLTRQIAEQCPESSTKKDLLAYLERVGMYCHQMNIIAKVKTDVQNSDEELLLAGVESATSLIENAKNLMNAVVLTVKASYVASTKYSRGNTIANPIVVWKMKAPEKKPLVRLERPKEVKAVVRKASQRHTHNPVKILSEFQI